MKSFANLEPRRHRITVRGLSLVLILGLAVPAAWAAKAELNQLIPEVQLKDGRILHDVTFVSVGGASIVGKWAEGRGSIPLAQLPDALRADLVPALPAKPVSAPPTAPAPGPTPAATSAATSPADPFVLPTEFKLNNGFVMRQAKVLNWQGDAVMVSYVGGQVLVKLADLVPEQRKQFEAHRVLVSARQARINAAREAQKNGQTLAPMAPSGEELEVLIQAGIAAHQLVVGMTKKEVFQAIGAPARTLKVTTEPDYLYWFYPGKGRDAKGAPCDRIVGFNKGILDGWKDE